MSEPAPTHARKFSACSLALALGTALLLGLFIFAWKVQSKETVAVSYLGGAAAFGIGTLLAWWPRLADFARWPIFGRIPAVFVAALFGWAAILVATVFTYSNSGWDECAYQLSGLALRGYGTEYESWRAPVTHFVAAAFIDAPALASPVLAVALLAFLSYWAARRWSWSWAAVLLLLLAAQNVFVETYFGLLSETPAALLLLGGFYLIARQHLLAAGAVFALVGLARWNLAVIPVAVTIALLWPAGWRGALRFALGGAIISAIFFGLSFVLVDDPIHQIIRGNLAPAYAWAGEGETKPTVWSRIQFYSSHAFFLTPPVLLAIASRLLNLRRARSEETLEDWVFRAGMPIGIVVYAGVMLFLGAHFPRFMAPLVPCALLLLIDWLNSPAQAWAKPSGGPRAWVTLACVFSFAWGLWPGSVLLTAKEKKSHAPIFSPTLRASVAQGVPRDVPLYGTALLPLCADLGKPAMVELRHTIYFTDAEWTPNGGVIPAPDPSTALKILLLGTPPDAYLLVPASLRPELPAVEVLAGDDHWLVVRRTVP